MGKKSHMKLAEPEQEAMPPAPFPLSPARIALAAAIDALADAKKELKHAQQAAVKAQDERWAARDRLKELETSSADIQPDYAADLINAVKSGSTFDPASSGNFAAQQRAKIQRATEELELWQRTAKSCDAAISQRKDAVERAENIVEAAAKAVIVSSADDAVRELMDGIDHLHAELVSRRLALRFLLTKQLISDDDATSVQGYLRLNLLPGGWGSIDYGDWEKHPTQLAWQQAMENLRRDPTTALPPSRPAAVG